MLLTRRRWLVRALAAARHALVLPATAWAGNAAVFAAGVAGKSPSPPTRVLFRGRKFRELLGLGVKFAQGEPVANLANLKELRVNWVRDTVLWPAVEPVRGEYKAFAPEFRSRLDFYRTNNIGLVFLLAFGNSLAYPPGPNNPNGPVDPGAFARYAVEVARQLKASGVRFVLEIWNEPHNFVLRPLVGGEWNGKPPSPWVDQYVRIVRETVRQVKAFDAGIRLLSDDDMWVLHYWFLEAGLPAELDGFAFHPYVNESAAGPEVTAVTSTTEWTRPFTVVDADRSFVSAVRRLREQGLAKLGRQPQLWVTEWGWTMGQKTPYGPVTEDMLAGLLPRAFIVAEAAGIEGLCWFSSQDSVDGPIGLIANDGRKRKSYFAFKTMAEQLGDFEYLSQRLGANHPSTGVQAHLFRNGARHKLALWSIEPTPRLLVLPDAMPEVSAVDALGRDVPLESTPNFARGLRFSSAPIYLSGIVPDAVLDAALATLEKA